MNDYFQDCDSYDRSIVYVYNKGNNGGGIGDFFKIFWLFIS